ncbi:MAG TPA: 2-phospho-L-lactate transferase [Stellaceae bacterium]|nr:2-phospho-L-lactate transferase [Stellaceae bacterium]
MIAGTVLALAGGVGGAKLADGLAALLGGRLGVIVNTGDDFEHMGLSVSPDLDTVMYTLAGIANPETGWGIAGESWAFLDQAARLGGPSWFRLGDRDLATHVLRTERLRRGERLSAITADLCRRLGIAAHVLPMSDDPVRTVVETAEGPLAFQEYFVRRRCEVPVTGFAFAGAAEARPTEEIAAALAAADLAAIVICPSNPFVSVDPILAVPGLRPALRRRGAPIVAVSPIIGGAAVKGPAAKMMRELRLDPSALTVAEHYAGFIDGMLIDEADGSLAPRLEARGLAVRIAPTLMKTQDDRRAVARQALALARAVAARRQVP